MSIFSARLNSLRWRLLSLLFAVLVIMLLSISLGVANFVSVNEQDAWQARHQEAAHRSVETLKLFLQRVESSLATVGLLDRDYLASSSDVLSSMIAQNPGLLEIIRLDVNGKVIAQAHQDSPLLANLFTIPQSTWFRKAAEGERYTSDIGIAPTGEPYQIMAIPGVGGEVIVARIRMMLLWNAISDLQFGDTGQAYIVDQTGRVIAHSDSDVVMAKTNLSGRPELIFPSVTETHRWIGPYTNFLGSRVVGTITRVRGFDWVVITEVAQSEARAITRRAGFVLGGGIALFGALALWIMSILFDRQLFRPIAALEAGTKRFSEGDLTYQIEMAQHDEIGHAAQMFNEMGARLHKRESELNTQAVTLSKEVGGGSELGLHF